MLFRKKKQKKSFHRHFNIKYVKTIIEDTMNKPESKVEIYDKIESLIAKIDSEDKECILTGDMNCSILNPGDNNTRHIKRIYTSYGFKQMIKELLLTLKV